MVSRVVSVAFKGIEAVPVDVQVQICGGVPSFQIVGLADKAVSEAKERVRGALSSLGLSLPARRITVNLAPANLPKEGTHYDLPIAIALLGALEILPASEITEYVALGELSLDGTLSPSWGVLPAAMMASALEKSIICPQASHAEAAWVEGLNVLAPSCLLSLINHFKGTQVLPLPTTAPSMISDNDNQKITDFAHIKGQELARRSLEIAAAGGHNLLMSGPPGAGKSLMASAVPSILPPLTHEEMLEISVIYSVAGLISDGGLCHKRPFRNPHHSASQAALIGGGRHAKPGEISLAHHGVLFLDELPEFKTDVLDALRQPMETQEAVIARAEHHITYPSNFQCIAAMNPCKCGYLYDASMACRKAPHCGRDYQNRLSGPLLDRFDIQIEVNAVSLRDLQNHKEAENSASILKRVTHAREKQKLRFKNLGFQGSPLNASLSNNLIEKICDLSPEAENLLLKAADKMRLSARGYHRVLKVARTIADLDIHHLDDQPLSILHVSEALALRKQVLHAP